MRERILSFKGVVHDHDAACIIILHSSFYCLFGQLLNENIRSLRVGIIRLEILAPHMWLQNLVYSMEDNLFKEALDKTKV